MKIENIGNGISVIAPCSQDVDVTWNTRLPVADQVGIMAALRRAGLPLAHTMTSDGESPQSQYVCVAAVRDRGIHALVATPSGLVYRFEPAVFELSFWAFAARHYYWVTFSMADREHVSALTGVQLKAIKGRTFSRKLGLSNVPLDALLEELNSTAQAGR